MSRSRTYIPRCFVASSHFVACCLCLLFISASALWCGAIPPSVVFNGVAAVLDTGSTPLNHPKSVAVDSAGNVYIADTAHNQIVKVTPAGSASALIVSGLTTGLSAPEGLALDGSGNTYVADTGNNRIVLVTSAGAGSAVDLGGLTLNAPRGVAIDALGNLYFSDSGTDRIVKLPSGGSAAVLSITGLGTALSAPAGLGVDVAGNLYIADAANNRIVKVTTAGAGSGVSISGLGTALSGPNGVAVDSFGNLFIADSGNNRIVEVTSGGAGAVLNTGSLTLNLPLAVAIDASGVVYLADMSNSRIVSLMMSAVGFGQLQVGASSGKSLILPFTIGVGATLGSVQALTLGAPSLDFTLGAGTTCTNGTTNTTCNVEVQFLPLASGLRRGGVALFDQSSVLVAVVPVYGTGGTPLAVLSPGTASIVSTGGVSLGSPFGAAIDGAGNIYVGNYTASNVVKIAAGGGSASVVSTGALTLNETAGVVVDGAGNLYIADYGHSRIVLVKSDGAASVLTITGLGTAINQPAGLALDGAGNLYIADWGNTRVVEVSPAGAGHVLATGSYTLTTSGVTGVAADPSGNVYIADRAANHIVKVAPSGAASLVTVTGLTLANPQGVAADSNGNIYIADSGHARVVQVPAAGTASVVQTPGQTIGILMFGVTLDASGNIFAMDWSNNRVLKVNVTGAVLSFANTRIGATSSDSPKTAMVTNLGNQVLTFSANPGYTADFPENSADANPCTSSTSLDPGEACDVSVSFSPQSAGSLSTNVVVTNNHLNGSSATQNVGVSGTGLNPITTTITWAQPSAIAYGTSLSGILNAAATDGSNTVAGTFAYTATPQGGTASAVTATTLLEAGNYTLSVGFTPDSLNYASAIGSVSLTVNAASPAITWAQPSAIAYGTSLSGILNAAATDGSNTVAGTFAYTATPQGGTASAVTATTVLEAGNYTLSVSFTPDSLNYASATGSVSLTVNEASPAVTWAQPSAIAYGTSLSGILNAAASDGSSAVAGTFAYTATPQGGTASAVTAPTVLGAGDYTLSVTFTPSNATRYTSATGSVSLTVNKVAPSVALTSSANPALVSASVALTATVSSSVSTPSGTVNFYDGTTLLGSGTLASGVAAYATSTLSSSTHSITAAYAGDSNFSSVTSSAVSQVVSDLTVNVAGGGSSTATVAAGGTATYNLSIAPSTGSAFPAAVAVSAAGAPAGSTVTITPQVIAAGDAATNVTVAVRVPAASAAALRSDVWLLASAFPLMGILMLPFGTEWGLASRKRAFFAGLLLIALVSIGAFLGCGGSSKPAPAVHQPANYTLTVTATSGSVSHSTILTLTVQ